MKSLSLFQVLLLVIFGGFAVAGVLIFAFAIGGGSSNAIGKVVIWGTLDATEFNAVLRQAADQNPALNQVSYVQQDPATYETQLTQALASGTGPDLFIITQDHAYKDMGEAYLLPSSALSQTQFSDTFVQAAAPFSTGSGSIALPLVADPLVLYWNKDLFAGAGFSEPPRYWDQLPPAGAPCDAECGMAQALTKTDPSGDITKSAIAFGEYGNVDNAKDILALLMMQAGSTITAYDSAGKLTSQLQPKAGAASSTEAAQSALRFYTEFSDPSSPDYSWNRSLPDAQQDFSNGDLALYIGYASEQGAIARANPNLNFAVAPLPQIRAQKYALGSAKVYGFAVPRAGAHAAAALQAASLLISAANSQAFSTALGLPSARRDVLAEGAQNAMALFDSQALIAYSWVDPDPDATASVFQGMIEDTTSGTLQVADAVQRADQQISHLIAP